MYFYTGHRLKGEIRGSQKNCHFHDYHISERHWFHFTMILTREAKHFNVYSNGHSTARRKCENSGNGNQHNPVYTLGADEALAGNSNRDFDVSFDDLVLLFQSSLSNTEIKAPTDVATGMIYRALNVCEDCAW